jgi:hypothetical protein
VGAPGGGSAFSCSVGGMHSDVVMGQDRRACMHASRVHGVGGCAAAVRGSGARKHMGSTGAVQALGCGKLHVRRARLRALAVCILHMGADAAIARIKVVSQQGSRTPPVCKLQMPTLRASPRPFTAGRTPARPPHSKPPHVRVAMPLAGRRGSCRAVASDATSSACPATVALKDFLTEAAAAGLKDCRFIVIGEGGILESVSSFDKCVSALRRGRNHACTA